MGTAAVVTSGFPVLRREQMWNAMQRLVLNGLSSPHTRRSYSQALGVFVIWFCSEPGRLLTKAVVQEYRVVLERKGLAPSSINVCLAAIRKFALEACDNGLLAPEIASAISRVRGAKQSGVRRSKRVRVREVHVLGDPPAKNKVRSGTSIHWRYGLRRHVERPERRVVKAVSHGASHGLMMGTPALSKPLRSRVTTVK